MKNSLRITLAVVLIALGLWGYSRNMPRPLTDCFPEGEWDSVWISDFVSVPGEAGEPIALP